MTKDGSMVINRFEPNLNEAVELAFNSFNVKPGNVGIPYIVGKPGGGKTQMISQKSKELGYGFLSYEPALERVEKFGGIPDLGYETGPDSYVEKISIPLKKNDQITEGNLVRATEILHDNITQADFIKSIIKMFNL